MKSTLLSVAALSAVTAFAPTGLPQRRHQPWLLMAEEAEETKEAQLVSGEELEVMLTEWDAPLVVDAYATW